MGMKEIDNTMEILELKEARSLEKKNNISIFSHLSNNKVLVKYSDKISQNIKKLYKEDTLDPNDSVKKII